jgi:hypothetical protein
MIIVIHRTSFEADTTDQFYLIHRIWITDFQTNHSRQGTSPDPLAFNH